MNIEDFVLKACPWVLHIQDLIQLGLEFSSLMVDQMALDLMDLDQMVLVPMGKEQYRAYLVWVLTSELLH